jgi:hypothetical protein
MEKPATLTLEVKTHEVEYGLRPDGRRVNLFREDRIDEDSGTLFDGFRAFLRVVSSPGFIEVKPGRFRPHSDIAYVELKESVVTQVVKLQRQEIDGPYKIISVE